MSADPLLLALQHSDAAFPSGGFAFSQGLEASSALAGELGPFDFGQFVLVQIRQRWVGADRVALVRAMRCVADPDALAALDREVEASTASEPLREGSRRNGAALLTTHERLGTPGAADYRSRVRRGEAPGHVAVVQGLVWSALGFDVRTAALMSGYQAVMALATAAVRLGLIGAIEAQRQIAGALVLVAEHAASPVVPAQPLRAFSPLAEIGLARHALSDLRLFSN